MTQINPTSGITIPPQTTQDVVIPATAFVELENSDAGPYLAVYATRDADAPLLRIRVGAGAAEDREEAAEAFVHAARQMHTRLVNVSLMGGAA